MPGILAVASQINVTGINNMIKTCGKFLLSILAIITGIIGIFLITIKNNFVNPEVYKQAIESSEFYYELEQVIIEKINAQVMQSNTDESQEEILKIALDYVFDKLNLSSLFQKSFDTNFDNFFAWINGEVGEIFIFFPRTELEQNFSIGNIKQLLLDNLKEFYMSMPECTDAETVDVILNSIFLETYPSCYVPESENFIDFDSLKPEVEKKFNEIVGDQSLESFLDDSDLGYLSEKTPITTIFENSEKNSDDTIQKLENIKSFFNFLGIGSWILIEISLLLAIFSSLLGGIKLGSISNFFAIYLITGIILLFIGLSTSFLPELLLNSIPINELSETPSIVPIMEKVTTILSDILRQLFETNLQIGLILVITNILGLLTLFGIKSLMKKNVITSKENGDNETQDD